jgi:hypothetical protein
VAASNKTASANTAGLMTFPGDGERCGGKTFVNIEKKPLECKRLAHPFANFAPPLRFSAPLLLKKTNAKDAKNGS